MGNELICPGYISNSTYDKCIGDVLITSPDFAYLIFFVMVLLFGSAWAYIIIKKGMKNDVSEVQDE